MIEDSALRMAFAAAQAADDKKATQILVLEVGRVSILADYFVIATGLSGAQIRAIASSVEERLKTEFERLPIRVEGLGEAGWVLADYGEVIIHVFLPKERDFYQLEAFWGHAPRLDLSEVLPVY